MKAKNTQDSNFFPNAKLLIILVFVAILAVFVKEFWFDYYEKKNNAHLQQNIQQNTDNQADQGMTQEPVQCSSLYMEIEEMMDERNHCVEDSDCEVLMLGGEYIEFGCYHFIHKDEGTQSIFEKMDKYNKDCDKIINKCAPSPESRCVDRKCIAK